MGCSLEPEADIAQQTLMLIPLIDAGLAFRSAPGKAGEGAPRPGHGHGCPAPASLTLMELAHGRQAPWTLAGCHGASIGVMTTRIAVLASIRDARPECAA